jgi:nicotinamidase-related amidase
MELPLPPHWDPSRVEDVWRVPYEERALEAELWARQHGLGPAREDSPRIGLLAVDTQNTFCTPGFELFVPGAPDDNRRLCEFVYRNLESITQIVPTLDTHQAMQVFHAAWLVDEDGLHPPPYTIVSADDIARGVWRAADPAEQENLLEYARGLEARGRFKLTIWPYHAMLGGIGHSLVSAVEEAIFFHGIARDSAPSFQTKGDDPRTEHYSALGTEVGEFRNQPLLDLLRGFDKILIAGQAKSHCVSWTLGDLLDEVSAERLYLLEDCTSPVVVPGAVDYTEEANAAVERFAALGVNVVRSTDPLSTWPGLDETWQGSDPLTIDPRNHPGGRGRTGH